MSKQLDAAVTRLARNMTIAQVALQTRPVAALFALQVEALANALEDVVQQLETSEPSHLIQVAERPVGPGTAGLLADALDHHHPTPDTVPESWT